jgi:hypothetical protein
MNPDQVLSKLTLLAISQMPFVIPSLRVACIECFPDALDQVDEGDTDRIC